MTMEEIVMHLAAGQFFGKEKTCGTKIRHDTEEKAKGHADALNRRGMQSHEVEPYPCYWCSDVFPETNPPEFVHLNWHVGRTMEPEERRIFLELGTYYTAR